MIRIKVSSGSRIARSTRQFVLNAPYHRDDPHARHRARDGALPVTRGDARHAPVAVRLYGKPARPVLSIGAVARAGPCDWRQSELCGEHQRVGVMRPGGMIEGGIGVDLDQPRVAGSRHRTTRRLGDANHVVRPSASVSGC